MYKRQPFKHEKILPHRRRRCDCPPGQPVFLFTGFQPRDSAWSIFARYRGFLRGAIVPVACVYCRASTPPSGGDLSELAWVMPLRVMAICARISLLPVEESLELRVWAGAFPPFMNWPGFHSVTSRLISRQRTDTPQYSKPEDRLRVTIRRPEIYLWGMFLRPSSR